MEVKICIKCGKELPFTIEFFNKAKVNRDGFSKRCKVCEAEYNKQWRENNKEKLLKYKKSNKKHIAKRTKLYRETRKEETSKYNKEYKIKHLDYYADHIKQWHENNKLHSSEYKKKHLEENRISCNKYRAIKRLLPSTLTIGQWNLTKKYFNDKCAYCGQTLVLTQEHFLALSKGGEFTHNNIIPSCQSCNSSKGNRDFFTWYPKYKYYSKQREKSILKYLNYKDETQQLKLI